MIILSIEESMERKLIVNYCDEKKRKRIISKAKKKML